MNIGEEQDPIELPMPVDPRKVKRETPAPIAVPVPTEPTREPAKEPAKQDAQKSAGQFAQELLGGKPLTDWQAKIMDRIIAEAQHG
jgi:hypothetical protein